MPIYALINLFIHILQSPQLPSVQSDLLVMDVGAGHFARMELATDFQISTPFVKDMAQMARNVVEDARRVGKEGPRNTQEIGDTTLPALSQPRMAVMGAQEGGNENALYQDVSWPQLMI